MHLLTDPVTRERHVLVFGGTRGRSWVADLHVLSLRAYRWALARVEGKYPAPRCYHAAAVVGTRLVVFGGNDGTRR